MSIVTTPAQVVELIYDDLRSWAKDNGGDAHLTQSPFDLLHYLQEPPGGWRLTLHWAGDRPADSRVRDGGVVINSIRIIVDGRLGLSSVPKIGLIKGTASRTPFLTVIDNIRQRVMAYTFPWIGVPNNRIRYLGCDDNLPLPSGVVAAVYALNFELYSVQALPDLPVHLDPHAGGY